VVFTKTEAKIIDEMIASKQFSSLLFSFHGNFYEIPWELSVWWKFQKDMDVVVGQLNDSWYLRVSNNDPKALEKIISINDNLKTLPSIDSLKKLRPCSRRPILQSLEEILQPLNCIIAYSPTKSSISIVGLPSDIEKLTSVGKSLDLTITKYCVTELISKTKLQIFHRALGNLQKTHRVDAILRGNNQEQDSPVFLEICGLQKNIDDFKKDLESFVFDVEVDLKFPFYENEVIRHICKPIEHYYWQNLLQEEFPDLEIQVCVPAKKKGSGSIYAIGNANSVAKVQSFCDTYATELKGRIKNQTVIVTEGEGSYLNSCKQFLQLPYLHHIWLDISEPFGQTFMNYNFKFNKTAIQVISGDITKSRNTSDLHVCRKDVSHLLQLDWKNPNEIQNSKDILCETIKNCLKEAEEKGKTSVVMPLFCCTSSRSAKQQTNILQAISEFLQENIKPSDPIKVIRFICEAAVIQNVVTTLGEILGISNVLLDTESEQLKSTAKVNIKIIYVEGICSPKAIGKVVSQIQNIKKKVKEDYVPYDWDEDLPQMLSILRRFPIEFEVDRENKTILLTASSEIISKAKHLIFNMNRDEYALDREEESEEEEEENQRYYDDEVSDDSDEVSDVSDEVSGDDDDDGEEGSGDDDDESTEYGEEDAVSEGGEDEEDEEVSEEDEDCATESEE